METEAISPPPKFYIHSDIGPTEPQIVRLQGGHQNSTTYGVVFFTKPGENVTISYKYPMGFGTSKKKKALITETPYGPAKSTNARQPKKRK